MKFKTILTYLLKDRDYLDYWSLIHFGFGIIIGFLLKKTNWLLVTSVFACLSMLTFWEIIEPKIFKHILKKEFREKTSNQITDIIYGFAGFLVYWFYI